MRLMNEEKALADGTSDLGSRIPEPEVMSGEEMRAFMVNNRPLSSERQGPPVKLFMSLCPSFRMGGTMLDIGCGTGELAIFMSLAFPQLSITGVDASDICITEAQALADPLSLAGLNAVAALLMFLLPEREPHGSLYSRTEALLDILDETEVWPLAYLKWEMALLEELGYGLDLRKCAVTGSREDLIYVSPRTGRAVSRQGAGDWADRLLPLPLCMLGQGGATDAEIGDGLQTTGYFLNYRLAFDLGHKPLPEARQRFLDRFVRRSAKRKNQIDE